MNNLKRLREARGMTQDQAAEAFGLSKGGYIKIEDGDRGLKAERIAKAAEVFGVQPAEVFGEITSALGRLDKGPQDPVDAAKRATAARVGRSMRVNGEVAAGRWTSLDQHVDESPFESAPITPDPRWSEEAQYGLIVRGTSINKAAEDGDILHCVDLAATGLQPQNGELVIVERIQSGGHLRELTAKRYFLVEDAITELRPDSDDPKWQDPIELPYRTVSWTDPEGLQVEVRAVVIGSYRSMLRRR